MRRVTFSPEHDVPAGQLEFWKKWSGDAAKATDDLFAAYDADEPVDPDNSKLWGRWKTWLLSHVFHNKCAYCEGDVSAHAPQHAEHWRPKSKVTRLTETGEEEVVARDGVAHPGYWWLAYSWENLVPACDFCNTAGAKGTKFPIRGTYVFEPTEARDVRALDDREKPCLLHPWWGENPEEHIGFYEDGSAYAKDKSDLGFWTITVMGLNRENLVNKRRERQAEALDAFGQAASDAIRFDIDLDAKMRHWEGRRAPYSRAVQDRLTPIRGRVGPAIYGLSDDG